MKRLKRVNRWQLLGIVAAMALLFSGRAVWTLQAQIPETVVLGENKVGEVNEVNPTPLYNFQKAAGQVVTVQVLSLTPTFAPAVLITDSTGAPIQQNTNPTLGSSVDAVIDNPAAGVYNIQVSTANGAPGQFVLSVQQGGQPAVPPTPLTVGPPVNGLVDAATPTQRFSFDASPAGGLILEVRSGLPVNGLVVTLNDAATNETVGMLQPRLVGGQFYIPPSVGGFTVEVAASGNAPSEPYTIQLIAEGDATPEAPIATEEVQAGEGELQPLPVTGPCIASPAQAGTINVRSGPGTNYGVVTQMTTNQIATVTGRLADNSWWQINFNGVSGWAAGFVLRFGGADCASVTVLAAPVQASATPTATVGATVVTATPSATTETTPTYTPTATVDDDDDDGPGIIVTLPGDLAPLEPLPGVTLQILTPMIIITPDGG